MAAVSNTGVLTIHRIKREVLQKVRPSSPMNSPHDDSFETPSRKFDILDCKVSKVDEHEQFLKDIKEQVDGIYNTMRGRVRFDKKGTVVLGGIRDFVSEIRRCRRVLLLGCGTSYHVGLATRQILEELTQFAVMVDQASDFLDRGTPVFRDDVCFFLSQSGETPDILEAMRVCKREGALIVGITNVVGSSLSRESHCGIHLNTGPDLQVSNKAFTSQFISIIMFALVMSEDICSKQERRNEIIQGLRNLPLMMEQLIAKDANFREIAEQLKGKESILILGRGYSYAPCMEGALKIKEHTGLHCEALLGGEIGHGAMSVLNKQRPIIMVISKDAVHHVIFFQGKSVQY